MNPRLVAAAESLLVLSPLALLGGPREARGHASLRSAQTPRFARSGYSTASLRSARLNSAGGYALRVPHPWQAEQAGQAEQAVGNAWELLALKPLYS